MADNEQEEIEELRHVIFHNEMMKEERKISDSKYADKIVEKIVFAMISLILVGVLTALLALVVNANG